MTVAFRDSAMQSQRNATAASEEKLSIFDFNARHVL